MAVSAHLFLAMLLLLNANKSEKNDNAPGYVHYFFRDKLKSRSNPVRQAVIWSHDK